MAKVHLDPSIPISIPDSVFEYARRLKQKQKQKEKVVDESS